MLEDLLSDNEVGSLTVTLRGVDGWAEPRLFSPQLGDSGREVPLDRTADETAIRLDLSDLTVSAVIHDPL